MTTDELEAAMAAAAARDDFEEAARLRNELMVRRAAGGGEADGDFAGLKRQQPGAMGIGTQHPRPAPPAGWVRPKKPDPMTAGRSRRGKPD